MTPYKPSAETIIKVGTGKSAVPTFSISSYLNKGGTSSYLVTHIPTGKLVADCYYYKSLARAVCLSLIASYPTIWQLPIAELVYSLKQLPEVEQYLQYYRFNDSKQSLSLEEWLHAGNYKGKDTDSTNRAIPIQSTEEYSTELWEGDSSLAWVCHPDGRMGRPELDALIEGRRIPSEGLDISAKG